MNPRHHTRAALVLGALCAATTAYAHGTSNIEARFDVQPAAAAVGERVTLEVTLTELSPNAADGAVVEAAVFAGGDVQRFKLDAAEPLRFRAPFTLAEGSHDLRLYVTRGDVREVAMSGFQVNNSLTPIPDASRVLFFNAAGKRDAIPALDNLSGVLGGIAALIAIIVLLRRPRRAKNEAAAKPAWLLFLAAIGALMMPIGGYWDIAFHMAEGREGLLSPPHLLIYGGILSSMFVVGVALLRKPRGVSFVTHWRTDPAAFAAGIAMAVQLSSAPFDELWHTIFGLDVSVWSPPHAVLIIGAIAVCLTLASLSARGAGLSVAIARVFALGAALLAVDVFLAESVYGLPAWHVSQQRPAFVFPLLEILGAVLVAVVARRVVELRFAATAAIVMFLALRLSIYPILDIVDVNAPPRFPLWLPALTLIGMLFDVAGGRRERNRS